MWKVIADGSRDHSQRANENSLRYRGHATKRFGPRAVCAEHNEAPAPSETIRNSVDSRDYARDNMGVGSAGLSEKSAISR